MPAERQPPIARRSRQRQEQGRGQTKEQELVAWLREHGLDAHLLAVILNDALDKLGPDELRLAHGLLEAAFDLRHQEDHDSSAEESGDAEH